MIKIEESYLIGMKPEDMPNEDTRWIAESCGIEVAMKMMKNLGGISLYIPKSTVTENTRRTSDLPNEDTRLIANYCGVVIAVKILQEFPQSLLRIPKLEYSDWAKKLIKKHFNGTNAKRLAVELCVSESFVYKYSKRVLIQAKKETPDPRFFRANGLTLEKLSLFDKQ
jgi:Mor family transcriptional regulator